MNEQNSLLGGIAGKVRGQIADDLRDLAGALGQRAAGKVTERLTGATERLTDYARQIGDPGLVAAATGATKLAEGKSVASAMWSAGLAGGKEKLMQALGRGGGGKGQKKLKVINIVEAIDVGVPLRAAYNQWTQFEQFPSFTKKIENVNQEADEKLTWKAQIFWSHRIWEATIIEQVPDSHIVWRAKGEKGYVDGAVTFHGPAPNLTRILVVLEYHPQGLFERTGNLWRAQGRRARLEIKHFARHVMTRSILQQDELEGWRGEIRDKKVIRDHETALREEREQREAEQRLRDEGPDHGDEEPEEDAEAYDRYDEDEEVGYDLDEEELEEEPEPRRRSAARSRRPEPTREQTPRPRPAREQAPRPWPSRTTGAEGGARRTGEGTRRGGGEGTSRASVRRSSEQQREDQ